MTLFTHEGLLFFLRWLHIFFGVVWIGHLYYFNFVQGAFFNETDASTKSNAIQKLVPRALWWFRWGAMWTMVTGMAYLSIRAQDLGAGALASSWGVSILTGVVLGLTMWANVWFVIWPNQKIVIASATQAASGGKPIPEAAAAGAKALLASRTNVLFSLPMLFGMAAARHLPMEVDPTRVGTYFMVFIVLWLAIEFNALFGKLGPLTTVKGVIHSSIALTAVIYVLMEVIL